VEIVYQLLVKPEVDLPIRSSVKSLQIEDAKINWQISRGSKLNAVVLQISGQPLQFDERGVILSTYPELESLAYRLSTYIANCLFKQTGFDAIDPETVLLSTPELRAETADEEETLARCPRRVGTSRRATWSVRAVFKPDEYPAWYRHSGALALYADGLRVTSPFQKYELFYKVIEYFFPQKGEPLDNAVAAHALPIDARFNRSKIEMLRNLRNRSAHPRAHLGHVNPEALDALREIRANLYLVQELANLLLQHPTF
jgi:hypothetical protein